mmetsp:Transcript_126967/g.179150  ORF Transcript_126967/g.179150 Transcript_126967/m.179150 type:complete len:203 (+) Transcript_126967:491-1099(+)
MNVLTDGILVRSLTSEPPTRRTPEASAPIPNDGKNPIPPYLSSTNERGTRIEPPKHPTRTAQIKPTVVLVALTSVSESCTVLSSKFSGFVMRLLFSSSASAYLGIKCVEENRSLSKIPNIPRMRYATAIIDSVSDFTGFEISLGPTAPHKKLTIIATPPQTPWPIANPIRGIARNEKSVDSTRSTPPRTPNTVTPISFPVIV